MTSSKTHPAKYTQALLPVMASMLEGCERVLDPFAGVGGIFLLENWLPETDFFAVEIEPEWAAANPNIELGNALHLSWGDDSFDGICTSPTYGNRMADHGKEQIEDGEKRNTYTSHLGRQLHTDNSGKIQWGTTYKLFHTAAWLEADRVLQPGGKFVLNIKDHIRNFERQEVTKWHIEYITSLGYKIEAHEKVKTPALRYGKNSESRVDYESVILFRKKDPYA